MITEKDIVDQLSETVSERVSNVIKESLSNLVESEISKALSRSLMEGHYYRSMSNEVIDGIDNIYSEIKSAKKSLAPHESAESVHLLQKSDSILDGIVKATEKATLTILDHLELMQSEISEIKCLGGLESNGPVRERLEKLDRTILDVMTELSFQDLTGQQIRRVVQSLKKVEEIVFNIYVTTEIIKKSKELSPEKDIDQLREETRCIIHSAQQQKNLIDQEGVDALLEQLNE